MTDKQDKALAVLTSPNTPETEVFQSDPLLNDLKIQFKEIAQHVKDESKAAHGNRYSEELHACAVGLRATGMSYAKIGFVLGCAPNTARHWINQTKVLGGRYGQLVADIKEGIAGKSYLLSNTILSSITDEDIEKANLGTKVTASAILIDKARLAEGKSTENHAVYIKKQVEIRAVIDEDKKRAKELDERIAMYELELAEGEDKT